MNMCTWRMLLKIFLIICMCVHMATHACECTGATEGEEGVESPRTGATGP